MFLLILVYIMPRVDHPLHLAFQLFSFILFFFPARLLSHFSFFFVPTSAFSPLFVLLLANLGFVLRIFCWSSCFLLSDSDSFWQIKWKTKVLLDQLVAYKTVVRNKDMETEISRHGRQIYKPALYIAIDASSNKMDYEIIVPKIEAGACYEIMNFRTNNARAQYRVVSHDTQIIFTSKTIFKKFSTWRHSIKTLPHSSKQANEQDILQTGKKMTIVDLGYKVFLVLEDETDEINALIIGRSGEKVFGIPYKDLKKFYHLQFGSRRNLPNSNDFLIYNISEYLTIQPTTLQSLSREITISSTIVSSSTTHVDTIGESHKRKRESVRRALFIPSNTSHANEALTVKGEY
ncbi:hypothetical protein DVH24_038878 [Malus domestica]|uniref:DUF223 domain-containing protein n=1 Tax=Malus domestica TaxID=3750 RepID=A0A498KDZ2_MALDO|nr:hypothetical protein DVH24_038878 [Malus domestica]